MASYVKDITATDASTVKITAKVHGIRQDVKSGLHLEKAWLG